MPDDTTALPGQLGNDSVEQRPARLAEHAPFRDLLRSRTRFVISASALLLTFNLLQPILSVFTPWLDRPAIGVLSVGWVYAFAQFIVPLALLHVYTTRARTYDSASAAIKGRLAPEGR